MLATDTAFIDVRKKEFEKEEITLISDAYVNNSQVILSYSPDSSRTTDPKNCLVDNSNCTAIIIHNRLSKIKLLIFSVYCIEVQWIYNIVIIPAVQESDALIHIYILYIYVYIPFHIIFHYSLSQDIEYSSLCYTVGSFCLSILYILV